MGDEMDFGPLLRCPACGGVYHDQAFHDNTRRHKGALETRESVTRDAPPESDADRLTRVERENRCGDAACQNLRVEAALAVLRGAKTHRQYADLIPGQAMTSTPRTPEPSDSLDAAWAAAEAALPEGWAGPKVGPEYGDPDEGGMPTGKWWASVTGPRSTDHIAATSQDTPAAALNALAAQLQAGRKEPKE